MKNLFCYNCVSKFSVSDVLLVCQRSRHKGVYKKQLSYQELLDIVRDELETKAKHLLELRPKTELSYQSLLDTIRNGLKTKTNDVSEILTHPILDDLKNCNHGYGENVDPRDLRNLCLDCLRCPEDKAAYDLICPNCETDLKLYYSQNKGKKIVAIIGSPYSGKTILTEQLLEILTPFEEQNSIKDKNSRVFQNQMNRDSFQKIQWNKIGAIELPEETDYHSPPYYVHSGGDFRVLYDIPGSWLVNVEQILQKTNLFLNVETAILLLDPYSIPELKRYLPSVPDSKSETASLNSAGIIIDNLRVALQSIDELGEQEQIAPNLIVVLSKADVLFHLSNYHSDENFREIIR